MFHPLDETALTRLDDDALIAYLRRARAAGHESASTALAVLVYGYWDNIRRRVALKVPAEAVEDVTADVILSVLQSPFDGTTVGELRAWLATITRRRIADFHRRRAPVGVPLEDVELAAPDATVVALADAVDRLLSRLGATHRQAVEIALLQDRPASEVPGLSATNVHQIVSRFRDALRRELDT